MGKFNFRLTQSQERRRKGEKTMSKKILAINFPKLMKKINSKTQETQDTKQDKEKSTSRHIVIKLPNTKEKNGFL